MGNGFERDGRAEPNVAWTALMLLMWPQAKWAEELGDAAGAELREFFGERGVPTNAELCRVIRWMAGPEGRQERAPSLRELIRAVCMRRKADRQSADVASGRDCALCRNTGWVAVAPSAGESFSDLAAELTAYRCQVPCQCLHGDAVRRTCEPWKSGKVTPDQAATLGRLATKGAAQFRGSLVEAGRQVGADPNGGRP
jgi:hypothetical protein